MVIVKSVCIENERGHITIRHEKYDDVMYERDLLADLLSYVQNKNQRLEVYTRAPTQLAKQAFEIVDRIKNG